MLTLRYREYFVQEVKAYAEGRIWGAGSFCLPGGFFSSLEAEEFIVSPEKVWTLATGNGQNYIRWIYTDGSGHTPSSKFMISQCNFQPAWRIRWQQQVTTERG